MLDILKNLDTVNYIVQDCLTEGLRREISPRNAFYVGDGYAMDIISTKGNGLNFRIRTDKLQNLCTVIMEKNNIFLRYNHKFFLKYNVKNDMITCNLFEEPFELDEMESTFFMQSTIGFGIAMDFNFCFDTLAETLILSRRAYDGYSSYIQAKN